MKRGLLLSLFPGIDGFGRGFESEGYCVLRGPDMILGQNIRGFKAPSNVFEGVIGGPPCQSYSSLNRNRSKEPHYTLLEYIRVVRETKPDWFLLENVVGVPEFNIEGYQQQRFHLDLAWWTDFSRLRVFVFGSRKGVTLNPIYGSKGAIKHTALDSKSRLPFADMCSIMGLPEDFDLPSFSLEGKKRAVANAVPLQMSAYMAGLIKQATQGSPQPDIQRDLKPRCACGCGRELHSRRKKYATDNCRLVAFRARSKRKNL